MKSWNVVCVRYEALGECPSQRTYRPVGTTLAETLIEAADQAQIEFAGAALEGETITVHCEPSTLRPPPDSSASTMPSTDYPKLHCTDHDPWTTRESSKMGLDVNTPWTCGQCGRQHGEGRTICHICGHERCWSPLAPTRFERIVHRDIKPENPGNHE